MSRLQEQMSVIVQRVQKRRKFIQHPIKELINLVWEEKTPW